MDADSSVHAVLRSFRPGSRQLLRERARLGVCSPFAAARATCDSAKLPVLGTTSSTTTQPVPTLPRIEEQLDRFRRAEAGWASLRDVPTVEGRGDLTDVGTARQRAATPRRPREQE